jgi:hypothetical protein
VVLLSGREHASPERSGCTHPGRFVFATPLIDLLVQPASLSVARCSSRLLGDKLRNKIMMAACAGLLAQGCSSRPREFTPTLGVATADQAKFDAASAECKQLYVTGKLDSNGRLASGGAGVAAGSALGLAGGAAAASAGLYGGMAVASATVVLLPVAVISGAWGMAKIKRNAKEKAIQRVMAGCLHDRGFDVIGWQKAPKAREKMAPRA